MPLCRKHCASWSGHKTVIGFGTYLRSSYFPHRMEWSATSQGAYHHLAQASQARVTTAATHVPGDIGSLTPRARQSRCGAQVCVRHVKAVTNAEHVICGRRRPSVECASRLALELHAPSQTPSCRRIRPTFGSWWHPANTCCLSIRETTNDAVDHILCPCTTFQSVSCADEPSAAKTESSSVATMARGPTPLCIATADLSDVDDRDLGLSARSAVPTVERLQRFGLGGIKASAHTEGRQSWRGQSIGSNHAAFFSAGTIGLARVR